MAEVITDIRHGRVQNTAGEVVDRRPPRQIALAYKNRMMERMRNFDVPTTGLTEIAAVFVVYERDAGCFSTLARTS